MIEEINIEEILNTERSAAIRQFLAKINEIIRHINSKELS